MFKLALRILPVGEIPESTLVEACQLDCSLSILDAAIAISTHEEGSQVICIAGHPGGGKSTYTQALLRKIICNHYMDESDILYLEIGRYDTISSMWNSGIEIAKTSGDRDIVALLASNIATQEAKLNAIAGLLNNFKIITFDNMRAGSKDPLHTVILSLIKRLDTNVICVSNLKPQPAIESANNCIIINGLSLKTIRSLALETIEMTEDKDILECTYARLLHNPKAIQLYLKSCAEFGVYEVDEIITPEDKTPVSHVLEMIWPHLTTSEKCTLLQLGELRQPLPVKGEVQSLARVIRIGLVKYEIIASGGVGFGVVSMDNCVQDFVQCAKGLMVSSPGAADDQFSVFDSWSTLLGHELLGLVQGAKSNSWPFIPEKWQYVTNAGEKESYNVKDLLTQKNGNFPHLTQFDILQECLHHSILRNDYENMAAIIFVLDRFIYWQGGSKMLLSIVDSITKGNPQLPIAPQLVIRKARILRTSGELQGAEKVLDKLLNEREKLDVWQYKEKHDHHLVRAVCVQIKGEIQASLGQWLVAASYLLDSVNLFKTLPKVDKKGLSCSLGLLVNTLQNMSIEVYQYIAGRYSLTSPHPYLQAYDFAREAAQLAVFTPLFFARHKRRAGEMMLEYSQVIRGQQRSQLLNEAARELKESLKAHKGVESLNSREQYYEFIAALYKTSCVYDMLKDHKTAKDLKGMSAIFYEHYCRHQASIVHDLFSWRLINSALFLLGLPSFGEDAINVDSMQAIPGYSQGLSGGSMTTNFEQPSDASMDFPTVDRCATTLKTISITKLNTVDGLKAPVPNVEGNYSGVEENYAGEKNSSNDDQVFNYIIGSGVDVHECESSRYDAVHSSWQTQRTLVYIGEQLNLSKGKRGAQRNPFMVEYLNQDEPLGKYVGKRYKKALGAEQYREDVRCQMTARYYVGLFNQDLYNKGIEVSHIQFLPVVMLQLLNDAGEKTPVVYNVEPYIHGDFTKLTNNWDFVNKEGQGSKLVLAFSHFTYAGSNQSLVIVDHQGWTSSDHLSTTFLTDPQIHSVDRKHFGTGNLGKAGIDTFWDDMHTECNEICHQLGLERPHGK